MNVAGDTEMELTVRVEGEYEPAEPRSYYFPGHPEDAEVVRVLVDGHELDEERWKPLEPELRDVLLEAGRAQLEADAEQRALARRGK